MGPRFEKIPSSSTASNGKQNSTSLLKLEQLLATALPKSVHMFVLCRMARQNRFPPDVDVQIYVYTESERDNEWCGKNVDDIFVICIERPNIHAKKGIIIFPPSNPSPEMIHTFDQFVGWSEPQVFQCVPTPFWTHLENLCTAHGNLKPENNSGVRGIMFAILNIERAKGLQSDVDDNLTIRPLLDEDVAEIAENWKWRAPHSEQVIRTCIKTFASCGLFVKREGVAAAGKDEEEMASSVLFSPLGVLNVLYTPEKHRRKGYGKIVMEWATRKAALQLGIPMMAEIEIWNDASRKLLEKVGYVEVFKTTWYYYDPPVHS